MAPRCIVWLRGRTLRVHDNAPLAEALKLSPEILYPIVFLDPEYVSNRAMNVGVRRWMHLLESMEDLDTRLRGMGSRLMVLRGDPLAHLPALMKHWKATHLFYERDATDPYGVSRDGRLGALLEGIHIKSLEGHTLYEPEDVCKKSTSGMAPLTLNGFLAAIAKLPTPRQPHPPPTSLPRIENAPTLPFDLAEKKLAGPDADYSVPFMRELGLEVPPAAERSPHKGGETEALKRLEAWMARESEVAKFAKPETSPTAVYPKASTTVLSPYLKFGTLSARTFYHRVQTILSKPAHKNHTVPPTSLLGQLYWREFYYVVAAKTPNWTKMEGNPLCLQVEWKLRGERGKQIVNGHVPEEELTEDEKNAKQQFLAWKFGRTGYPWIDAVMRQLRTEGWIHHLARHAVACFLTRGDLYISWERGAEVFEELLLDADIALNIGNWLWLSASAFFTAYFRVYSPVAFPFKYDKKGVYAKKYVKEVAQVPEKYVWEPWKAPMAAQMLAKCVVGTDYPAPIVQHDDVRSVNIGLMASAYKAGLRGQPTASHVSSSSGIRGSGAEQVANTTAAGPSTQPGAGSTGGFGEEAEEIEADVPSDGKGRKRGKGKDGNGESGEAPSPKRKKAK